MINFTCNHCGQALSVPDESAGRIGQCPHCGKLVDIPAASPVAPAPSPGPAPDSKSVPLEAVMTPPERREPFPERSDYPRPPRERRDSFPERRDYEPAAPAPFLELVINSIILGGVGLLLSPAIPAVRGAGIFCSILLGLAVLGLGGLGLTLAIFSLIRAVSAREAGHWYAITALVLSGLAVLVGLTMFIGAMARPFGI